MTEVSIRDLRNHGDDIVDRVAQGERVTITRSGKAVAELRPLARPPLPPRSCSSGGAGSLPVDPEGLRADVDSVLDAGL